jgi:hypothetical protein
VKGGIVRCYLSGEKWREAGDVKYSGVKPNYRNGLLLHENFFFLFPLFTISIMVTTAKDKMYTDIILARRVEGRFLSSLSPLSSPHSRLVVIDCVLRGPSRSRPHTCLVIIVAP